MVNDIKERSYSAVYKVPVCRILTAGEAGEGYRLNRE